MSILMNFHLQVFCFSVNEEALPCKVTWFHNEKQVVSSPRYLMEDVANEFKLALKNIELCDDGNWACQVSNDLGSFKDGCKVTMKGNE